jgi:hypothetical protein
MLIDLTETAPDTSFDYFPIVGTEESASSSAPVTAGYFSSVSIPISNDESLALLVIIRVWIDKTLHDPTYLSYQVRSHVGYEQL